MTMAAAMDTPPAAPIKGVRIARVDVLADFAAAEPVWRALEAREQLSTPYQSFGFQSAWQTHVGTREGLRPYIVVAYDKAERPLMVLPLVVGRENGMRVACYPGGKHVTFNMPLLARDFAAAATPADLDAL